MRLLALLLLLAAPAEASTLQQLDLYTSSANFRVTGSIGVAASTAAPTNYKFIINGPGGYLQFPDGTQQTTAGGGGAGSSTVTVNASQMSGNGTSAYPITLLASSVTLQGNSFNGLNQLVKTNGSGVIPLSISGSANSASVAALATTALSASSAAYATNAASADYALEAASLSSALSPIFIYPGIEVNTSPGYAYNWIVASTTSLNAKYYDVSLDTGSWLNFDKYGLVISSGIRAGASRVDGSGGVNIIGSDGKIPALTSDYFANLDGSALTGIDKTDVTKVPLGGGTMTGSLVFEPTSISTGNIIFQGGYPHSIQFNNASGASNQFLGEVQFLQNGTGKHRIISFGDASATNPQELLIGADTTSSGANVRISGNPSGSADLFVSSWTSVGVNTANPNSAYKLDVNGAVNSAGGFFKNGVEVGGGGDNLGNHIATMTLTTNYGINTSTIQTKNILVYDPVSQPYINILSVNYLNSPEIRFSTIATNSSWSIGNINTWNDALAFRQRGLNEKMILTQDGKLSIGINPTPTEKLEVDGNIKANSFMNTTAGTTNYIVVSTALYAMNGGSGSGSGGYTSFVIDDFTSQTNGSQTQFTLSQQPLPNSLQVSKNGLVLKSTDDYSLSGQVITMVSAPNTGDKLLAQYAVGISTTEKQLVASTNSWTGTNTFNNNTIFNSSITINANSSQQYALTIDTNNNTSDGYVLSISTNGIPKIYGYKTTDQSVAVDTIDTIKFDVISINNNFTYYPSTGKIYANESGYYLITGETASKTTFDVAYLGSGVYKNGNRYCLNTWYVGYATNNHYLTTPYSCLIYLTPSDYVEIRYYHGGGTQTISAISQAGTNPTHFTIVKIL